METTVRKEIEALRHMPVGQLRKRYAEVFGEETRSHHKHFLFRRIAWRIQALAEGGLSERGTVGGGQWGTAGTVGDGTVGDGTVGDSLK